LNQQYRKDPDGRSNLLLPKTRDCYEERMIRKVQPGGVLLMTKSEEEGVYCYEITGKKNLDMTFERVPMNAEQVEKVLEGIFSVIETAGEYLLSEENFILHPEFVFVGIPGYEVALCYYPEYGVPFPEQMSKFFEILLNRVDYREEKAISMVYAMYMELQEPDVTFESMKEKFQKRVTEIMGGEHRTINRKQPERVAIPAKEEPAPSRGERELPERTAYAYEGQKPKRKKNSFLGRFHREGGLRRWFSDKQETEPAEGYRPACAVMEETAPWEPAYTRVLSVKKPEKEPSLISEESGEVIYLRKFPFYVGSLPEYMDYVIQKDTVSRFHAKFIKTERGIALVDLNSTNGTKVNDGMLNVQEQRVLAEGDRIAFAEAGFSFSAGEV